MNTLQSKYRRILLLILIALASAGFDASAQKHVISGCVYEETDFGPEPIIGANVVLVNRQGRYVKGAVTDIDGNYTLEVPASAGKLKVKASFVGLETQEVEYTGQTTVNFTLKSSTTLKEVVVTGQARDNMGVSRRLQTSSIQKLDVTDLVEQSPVSSIEEAIQGQISGLDISIGGDPGAKNNIQIRGISSLDDNADPLIVLDGVPYTSDNTDNFSFSTASAEDFGALLNIAPSNIESIEVLKDASATAIYGSNGLPTVSSSSTPSVVREVRLSSSSLPNSLSRRAGINSVAQRFAVHRPYARRSLERRQCQGYRQRP